MTFLEEKEKVKPIYGRLYGYLEYAPKEENSIIFDKEIWEQVNRAIDLLNQVTGKDYNSFKIATGSDLSVVAVRVYAYKSQLASLVHTLYREYYEDYDEQPPFSKIPGMISIQNNNRQEQSQTQQQEQKVELEQMQQNAQKLIQAEYGKEQADKASDLIKKIILNPKNWAIIATSIVGLVHIGKIAFIAALPILGKVLLEASAVHST